MDLNKKFTTLSFVTDALSAALLYLVHAILIVIIGKIGSPVIAILYFAVCAIITYMLPGSFKGNIILAVVLGLIFAPFVLSRNLRGYAWTFISVSLGIERLEKSDLVKMRESLDRVGQYRASLSSDAYQNILNKKIKDEWILGCQTFEEAFDMYDYVLGKLGESDPYLK